VVHATQAAEDDVEASVIQTLPIVVLRNFALKPARGDLWNVLAEWGAGLIENKIAHVIVIGEGSVTTKTLTGALPSKPLNSVVLSDADDSNSLEFVREKLSTADKPMELSERDKENIAKLGGRMVDLELLVYKARSGQTITHGVDDIVRRNVVELRKAAFGDDSEDAKHLPWTRAQAWKIVKELAQKPETPYAKLLLDFPFKGAEGSLKALEEHGLISIQYIDGRASKVRPGKPVFRQAFASLVNGAYWVASVADTLKMTFSARRRRSSTTRPPRPSSRHSFRHSRTSWPSCARLSRTAASSVSARARGGASPRAARSTSARSTSLRRWTRPWASSWLPTRILPSRRRCLWRRSKGVYDLDAMCLYARSEGVRDDDCAYLHLARTD
jgi:hypothetical protein